MPRLPSGKEVGIDPTPANEQIKSCRKGARTDQLEAIQTMKDLLSLVRIVFFVPGEKAAECESVRALDARSLPGTEGLVSVSSGYTLADIKEATADWCPEDKEAFVAFLRENRTKAYLEELLERVQRVACGRTLPPALCGILDDG